MLVVSPSFRAAALWVIAGIGVLIGILFLVFGGSAESEKRERERAQQAAQQTAAYQARETAARSLIAIDALEFSNTSLQHVYAERWKLIGTVTNNSKQTLTAVGFQLTMKDCARSPCLTIGESKRKGWVRFCEKLGVDADALTRPFLESWDWFMEPAEAALEAMKVEPSEEPEDEASVADRELGALWDAWTSRT